ncbi:hypothetical protein ACP0J1_25035 [Pseudomonas aeruginosa]
MEKSSSVSSSVVESNSGWIKAFVVFLIIGSAPQQFVLTRPEFAVYANDPLFSVSTVIALLGCCLSLAYGVKKVKAFKVRVVLASMAVLALCAAVVTLNKLL